MQCHIYEAMEAYRKKKPVRFHVPGHKAAGSFSLFKDAGLDITELSFSDCLESPTGPIARAQEDIASLCGAQKSHILTDGGTCGILTMLYAVRKNGKVVIPRNAHKSVFNGCALLGIEPYILPGNVRGGVPLPPTAADIDDALRRDPKIGSVLVMSPDYYGNTADLSAIRKVCDRLGKKLLVDGAHGAYLKFDPDLSGLYPGKYADMWTDGSHKTMPTLTQGALLHVNDESLLPAAEQGLGIFRTTSPSYSVMASVEYGVKYMAENGAALIDQVKQETALLKTNLEKRGIPVYGGSQTLVLAVDFAGAGISARIACEELEKRGVYPEFSDGKYVLFYFSALSDPKDIRALEKRIRAVTKQRYARGTGRDTEELSANVRKFGFLTAVTLPSEEVPLQEAAGRVAAQNAGLTPPCWPLVIAGEQISEQTVRALAGAEHTFGVKDGKISVLKIGSRI